MSQRPPTRRPLLPLILAAVAVLLAACSQDSGARASWRGLEVSLPEGWGVFEEAPNHLGAANADLGPEAGDPGDRVVAMQFTHEPGSATADVWREWVEQEDGELESDTELTLDGVPATRLVFSHVTNGIPTREMVVTVPARQLYILAQPVPTLGSTDAPEVFLDHVDQFDQIVRSIDFGAPVES